MNVDKSVAKTHNLVKELQIQHTGPLKLVTARHGALSVPDPNSGVDVTTWNYQRASLAALTDGGPAC